MPSVGRFRAPAVTIWNRPETTVPSPNSGTRLCRSAYQPSPMAAKIRKNPMVAWTFRMSRTLILRSTMMSGPARAKAGPANPPTRPRKANTATGRVP